MTCLAPVIWYFYLVLRGLSFFEIIYQGLSAMVTGSKIVTFWIRSLILSKFACNSHCTKNLRLCWLSPQNNLKITSKFRKISFSDNCLSFWQISKKRSIPLDLLHLFYRETWLQILNKVQNVCVKLTDKLYCTYNL